MVEAVVGVGEAAVVAVRSEPLRPMPLRVEDVTDEGQHSGK
jgi:hypothetical protein